MGQITDLALQRDDARRREIAAWLVRDLPVFVLAGALFALCFAIISANGLFVGFGAISSNARLYFLAALAMVVVDLVVTLARRRPTRPMPFLAQLWRERITDPRVLAGVPAFLLVIVFMPFFSKLKAMIPLFNAFTWDGAFIAWDRALFFGYDAWQVLQPVFGYPIVTAGLAVLYHAWMLLIYVGTLYFLFARAAAPVRRQYLAGFFLIWTVIGAGMATALASVGPCFMEPIFGDRTFAAQMAYLEAANREVPVMTLHVQGLLLEWYRAGEGGLGSGITAMPSMHVAMAMLFWLAIRRVSPAAGQFFFVFLVLIWIGSVHLAYHYAVDGLVSVLATAVLWWAANRVLVWWDAQATLRTNTVPAE
jgi:hypothetical protein